MDCVPLDKNKHNRTAFDCGVEPLNVFLRLQANQQSRKDNSRTYVLEDENRPDQIIGYYTLTMASVDFSRLPENLQNKHPRLQAAGLIARLAVDKRHAGQGHGEWLLIDALKKLLASSESVAFPLVVVDAKSGAKRFYEKFGFSAFNDMPDKLFMTIADIRKSIA